MCIFQNEKELINLRFLHKITSLICKSYVHRYQSVGLSCVEDSYQKKITNIAKLKTALLSIWNDLSQEFTDNEILHFQRDF